jgi:hypothetical protein
MDYKFGFYRRDDSIPKEWGISDYLINNNQLKISTASVYPLVPLTAKKNIVVRYILYAMIELDSEGKKYSAFKQIEDRVAKNRETYNKLIKKKIRRITEISQTSKFNSTTYFKNTGKSKDDLVMREVMKKMMQFDKNAKAKKDDIYYALALLLGNFLEVKYVFRKQSSDIITDKKPNDKFYFLSKHGKILSQKFYDDNYIF